MSLLYAFAVIYNFFVICSKVFNGYQEFFSVRVESVNRIPRSRFACKANSQTPNVATSSHRTNLNTCSLIFPLVTFYQHVIAEHVPKNQLVQQSPSQSCTFFQQQQSLLESNTSLISDEAPLLSSLPVCT